MRDVGILLGGMLLGGGLVAARDLAIEELEQWRKHRKAKGQWFQPSEARRPAPPPPGGPQPTPRSIVGQRAGGGAHRPTQRKARFSGRVKRRVTSQPGRVAGKTSEESPGQLGNGPD